MSTVTPRRSKRYTPPAPPNRGRRRRGGDSSRDRSPDPQGAPGIGGARRLVAATVDALLVPAVVLGAAELAWSSGALRLAGVSPAGWNAWSRSYVLVAWTVTAVAATYHGVCTAARRRTAGKALAGLVVVTDDGRPPGPALALWRSAWNAVVYAPVVLAPVVAVVAAGLSLTGAHRSLADRAAGTRVVRAVAAGHPRPS